MLLALLASASGVSQAAISACSTTSGAAVAIPTPTASGNGCSSVDLNFDNITSTSSRGGATTYWATAGAINLVPTPDTIGTTTVNYSNAGWTDANGGGSSTATLSYQTTANNGNNSVSDAGYSWALSGLTFTPTFSSLNTNASGSQADTVSMVITFCFNATSATINSGGCVASNQGQINVTYTANNTVESTAPVINLTAGGVLNTAFVVGNSVKFTAANANFTSVFITNAVTLNAGPTGSVTMSNFAIGYDQTAVTPEPSTFGLLGFALVGLGAYARRRK